MSPDNTCFDFIKSHEGISLTAYQDKAGIWTIGYGTIHYEDNTPVKQGDTITLSQADEMIEKDVDTRTVAVNTIIIPAILNQNQFNALVSFAYNAGMNSLMNSTLLKQVKINPADPAIRDSFMVWNKAHINGKLVPIEGLTARRKAEADLYFTPVNSR